MLEAVWKHGVLFYAVGVMCVLGVISKITVSLTLRRLVKEAGKMGKSLHPLMKLVRAKFEHACMVSDKVQNIRAFVDVPSMAITIGGTIGVMMISFPAGAFKKIGSHLKIIVRPYAFNPVQSISQIVSLATEARMKGLLSLEDKLNEIDEPFLHNSLMLVVDSVDSEKVRKAMEAELEQMNRTLDMLKFKCWYYEQAIKDGSEDRLKALIPDHLPDEIRKAYENAHS